MCNWLRLCVLCLLALALPMQSIAGVVLAGCGMAHPAQPGTARQADPAPAVASNDAQAHLAKSKAAAQGSSAADEGVCEDGGHGRSGCGGCSACCLGAYAPPPLLNTNAVEEAAHGVLHLSATSFSGHIPAPIERPPRSA